MTQATSSTSPTRQHLEFLAPTKLINLNDRLHHFEKGRVTAEWRGAALTYARQAKLVKLDRAYITMTIGFTDARKRDVNNYQPTAKAVIDGLVNDYGLLPDDDDLHLIGPDLRRGDRASTPVPIIRIEIVDLGEPL